MGSTPQGYRPRLVDNKIESSLRSIGAVCIQGPKWCGKTWVGLNHSSSQVMLGDSTDNWNELNMVRLDLSYAFNGDSPRLIDEWQEVPEIWDALKSLVDRSMEPGRFILTGSSTPREGAIKHSGAGRIGTIMMRTMSLFESGDSDGSMTIRSMFDKVDRPPTK